MGRSIKLCFNLFLTTAVFNFFILILILLLNPYILVSGRDFLVMYVDIFAYYGPLWFLFVGITFLTLQFFAERKYPVGVFSPPTITYFMSFNILVISFFMFLNYDHYIEFLNPTTKLDFIKILLINLVLIIAGVVFVFFKKINKKWIQTLFFVILVYNIIYSYTAVVYNDQAIHALVNTGNEESATKNEPPRRIKVVLMDGLSLNLIRSLSTEKQLLNFNEMTKKGAAGRISGYKPNLDLSLMNSALTGLKPSQFHIHSNTKFKFPDVDHEFDVRPRYIFFRKSSYLKVTSFYNKNANYLLDHLNRNYERNNLATFLLIRPDHIPIYGEKSLHTNNRFVQLFSEILNRGGEKFDLLKRAYFFDDYLMKTIRRQWEDNEIYYSVVRFPGLGIVSRYFYQYHDPTIGGNISEADVKTYGWVIGKYYEYYSSIIGNLLSTARDDELLVIMSFFEHEPLPVWRRILVNLFDRKDIYVYKSPDSRGTVLLYEKNALKKDYPLKEISIYDLYPTLLYYAGFQLSTDMEGEVIREIFTDEFVLNNPIDINTNYNQFPK